MTQDSCALCPETRHCQGRLPSTTPADHPPRSVEGRAFGVCCFAGKLRSLPRVPGGAAHPAQLRALTPTSWLRQPLRHSLCAEGAYLWLWWPRVSFQLRTPKGGMERPRRAVRFARLIQRRGRDLGGPSARAAFGGNLSRTW